MPILIIDDEAAIRAVVRDTLELEGYSVVEAENGQVGLDLLGRVNPSLVLLDMRMPVLDGWGFARQLRERGTAVPVLVMTAARDARAWAEEIGAAGYVAKPFDLDQLLTEVGRLRVRRG